ncbi:MAG TPA: hypothetical protein VGK19_10180 [Capsulimonadaceae bacterium]
MNNCIKQYWYLSGANGNVLTDGTRTNVWAAQNRLVSCTVGGSTSTYDYGADGLRRSLTVNAGTANALTTYYVYDGKNCIAKIRRESDDRLLTTPAAPTAAYRSPVPSRSRDRRAPTTGRRRRRQYLAQRTIRSPQVPLQRMFGLFAPGLSPAVPATPTNLTVPLAPIMVQLRRQLLPGAARYR